MRNKRWAQQKAMQFRRAVLAMALCGSMVLGGVPMSAGTVTAYAKPVITELPDTERTVSEFNKSMFDAQGFATVGKYASPVSDRSEYVGTEYYRTVSDELEFLQAIEDAGAGKVKVIEITQDLDLGWNRLSDEAKALSCINVYEQQPHHGFSNPELMVSGVSQLMMNNIEGLTIFSTDGATVYHAEWKLQGTCSDIVIRNLKFDEMWQWDEVADRLNISKETGWTFIKINGANNVWIDHCSFSLAGDGNVDSENGANGVTLSWNTFGLETDYNPDKNGMIYKNITYMEQQYQNGALGKTSRYKLLRDAGSTPNEIMAYTAMHLKLNLNGAGDKDFTDGISNGVNQANGNQRLNVTHAFNKYTNIGSRIPFIRQGTGHLYNCYIDNWDHMELHYSKDYFVEHGYYDLSQCLYPRNGATVGADTCVFYGADEPIAGGELQSLDYTTSYETMTDEWKSRLSNTYNRALIVNSKVSKVGTDETYVGSSWDNNGENMFTSGSIYNEKYRYAWHNKSTIGEENWTWTSVIEGVENMTKENPPSTVFNFVPTYEKLPYTYQIVELDDVEMVVDTYSGAGTVEMTPADWLKTSYDAAEAVMLEEEKNIPATGLLFDAATLKISKEDMVQLNVEFVPYNATTTELTWTSSDPEVAEVLDSGLVVAKNNGEAEITATVNGTNVSAKCKVTVYQAVQRITLTRGKNIYEQEVVTLEPKIVPEDADEQRVTWKSSNEDVATVDENGVVTGISAGTAVITCVSYEDSSITATCRVTVKAGTNPDTTPTPMSTVSPEPSQAPAYKQGDVNKNGLVNAEDALRVLEHAANKKPIIDEESYALAMMNGDEVINAADALEILKIAAGIK